VRHTYATISQDAGHNVKTLSERIGHADVSVTAKIYTHKSRGTDRDMAQAMGELIELAASGGHLPTEALGTDRGTDHPNPDNEPPEEPMLSRSRPPRHGDLG
jgi:hypothetical protein